MLVHRPAPAVAAAVAVLLFSACAADAPGNERTSNRGPDPTPTGSRAGSPSPTSREAPSPTPSSRPRRQPAPVAHGDGRPRRALLTIPALGLRHLPVVPYRGWTDDAPGTEIQDTGVAASPHGPRGGTGPGGLGNYQVTAHRTSSTAAFADLPQMRRGDRVVVRAGGVRYVYEIRRTRETSFRTARSLAEQRAAVPGRPGAEPTRAFITLSTCATPEDHAEGNFWADEFGNPEHRIDKVGVLVRTTSAGRTSAD